MARVPLGPRPSLHPLRHRCSGFVRGLLRYYGGVRLLGSVHHRLRLFTFPMRASCVSRLVKPEISRFPNKKRAYMPGSTTTPGRLSTCISAPRRVAFRYTDSVGTRNMFSIAAQWLAYTYPYRRFADTLTSACARLEADAVRYTFIAVDLHHLFLAGLPAHLCENSNFRELAEFLPTRPQVFCGA